MELLVVVMIIVILVTMVTPTVYHAIELANRTACLANTAAVAKQCFAYMGDTKLQRGTNLPSAMPTHTSVASGNWNTNRYALWVMVDMGFVGRETFLCPSAKVNRRLTAPAANATGFTDTTLSYSYLSQVSFTDNNYNSAVKYTGTYSRGLRPSELAVIADANPGTTSSTDEEDRNSKNHKQVGQNVAFLDGHADWFTSPDIPGTKPRDNSNTLDDIYQPCAGGSYGSGTRGAINDAFLIP
ncbi:MAG: hypothetical protein GY794_06115 [bacterium]|nr:hypothetical protein [bacterium]